MGQRRTLLNKLSNSTRTRSKAPGTPNRRVIFGTAIDTGVHAVIYSFHTTKGRMKFRVVESMKAAEEAPAVTEEVWPEPITRAEPTVFTISPGGA